MGDIGIALFLLGLVCLPISIVVLLIRAIMKRNINKNAYFSGISLLAIIVGFVMVGMSSSDEETSENIDNSEVVKHEVKQSQNKAVVEEASDTGIDEEIYEDYEYSEMESYIENYREERKEEIIGQAEEYMYPFSEFPYENKKKSKKAMELYKKAMKASEEDFLYVEEISKGGIVSTKEIHYKKTIDTDNAKYKYYGKVNKNNEPEGMGILIENEKDAGCYIIIYYIGEFDNGYLDGYGIEYNNIFDNELTVKYEGEFKKGKYHGNGTSYTGSIESGGTQIISDWNYARMTGESNQEYDYLFEKANGGDYIYPISVASKEYEGEFKEGEYHGKGKRYMGSDENKQPILVYEGTFENGKYSGKGKSYYFINGQLEYEGQFKNGEYHGKGILYDEQGNVLHKGKFKNGKIA